jgi:hypothetical protein
MIDFGILIPFELPIDTMLTFIKHLPFAYHQSNYNVIT